MSHKYAQHHTIVARRPPPSFLKVRIDVTRPQVFFVIITISSYPICLSGHTLLFRPIFPTTLTIVEKHCCRPGNTFEYGAILLAPILSKKVFAVYDLQRVLIKKQGLCTWGAMQNINELGLREKGKTLGLRSYGKNYKHGDNWKLRTLQTQSIEDT